jgi:hypothetical protein
VDTKNIIEYLYNMQILPDTKDPGINYKFVQTNSKSQKKTSTIADFVVVLSLAILSNR